MHSVEAQYEVGRHDKHSGHAGIRQLISVLPHLKQSYVALDVLLTSCAVFVLLTAFVVFLITLLVLMVDQITGNT